MEGSNIPEVFPFQCRTFEPPCRVRLCVTSVNRLDPDQSILPGEATKISVRFTSSSNTHKRWCSSGRLYTCDTIVCCMSHVRIICNVSADLKGRLRPDSCTMAGGWRTPLESSPLAATEYTLVLRTIVRGSKVTEDVLFVVVASSPGHAAWLNISSTEVQEHQRCSDRPECCCFCCSFTTLSTWKSMQRCACAGHESRICGPASAGGVTGDLVKRSDASILWYKCMDARRQVALEKYTGSAACA